MRRTCSLIGMVLFTFALCGQDGDKEKLFGELLAASSGFSDFERFLPAIRGSMAYRSLPAIYPIHPGKGKVRISSAYGFRSDPVTGRKGGFHAGVDFACRVVTSVFATAYGTVTFRGEKGGYGKCVIIDHGFGFETFYAHLEAFRTSVGRRARRGEIIGFVGSTGKSTGNHLHYEIRKNGRPVDPTPFLTIQ